MYFYAKDGNNLPLKSIAGAGGSEKTGHLSGNQRSAVDGASAKAVHGGKRVDTNLSEKGVVKADQIASSPSFSCSRAFSVLWEHFTVSYSNGVVVVWSIWWALAMAGFLQVDENHIL